MSKPARTLWIVVLLAVIEIWILAGIHARFLDQRARAEERASQAALVYEVIKLAAKSRELNRETIIMLRAMIAAGCPVDPMFHSSAPLPASSIQATGGSPR